MQKRAWLFVVGLTAVAALTLLALGLKGSVALEPRGYWGVLIFVAVGVLSEALALDFSVSASKAASSSISYIPMFAAALTFPIFWTVTAGASIIAISDILIRRRKPWICTFNAAQYILALTVASGSYHLLGGRPFADGHFAVGAFFALSVTYFLSNIGIVAAFFCVRSGQSFLNIVTEIAGPGGGHLTYDLLASPIAIFAAWLYDRLYVGGLVVAILPLLLVRYTYLSAVQLRQTNRDLLRVLIKAIETRDPYTSGHSVRVSTLARIIATDMGLPRRIVAQVETAALLHDIGKIEALYAAIISKPHELTASERALIKTHATKGADMLLELTAFKNDEVIRGVRHHHERFDGTGYPDGLTGDAIPISARIIMISDALDAMLSDRPYRAALQLDDVRKELIKFSGAQFDPAIVSVIIRRDTLARAQELVKEQPPEAMSMSPRPVAVYGS